MTRIKKYIIIFVVIYVLQFAFLAFAITDIYNNGYNQYRAQCGDACFEKLKVDVTLDKSGDATIVEEYHAYRKKANPFVAIDKSFSKKAGESIYRDSLKFESGNGVWAPEIKSDSSADEVRFRINTNFTGRQTFRFSYKVKGLIKNLKDGQIFKFNFFNNNYGRKVIDGEFNIKMPSSSFSQSTLWFDGLRNQNNVKKDANSSTYFINVPNSEHTKQFFEVDMSFPRNTFVDGQNVSTMPYQTLQEFNDNIENTKMEDQRVENQAKTEMVVITVANAIGFIIALLILNIIYLLKEKPYRRIDKESAYWNVPNPIGPLAASMIIEKDNKVDLNHGFKADILYLVSRGYAKIEDLSVGGEILITKLADITKEPEEVVRLHHFLFNNRDQVRLNPNTTLSDPNEVLDFEAYKTGALNSFKKMGIFEKPTGGYKVKGAQSAQTKAGGVIIAVAFFCFIFSISSSFVGASYAISIGVVISIITLLITYAIISNRIREEKITVFEQWNGYKNYLSNYTLLKERGLNDVVVWKQHLVYATAFGVAENVLKVLQIEYPEIASALELDIPMMTGFYFAPYISTPSVGGSRSFGDFGGFGGGGSFGGGGFSGGGSGGGGGFL